METRGRQISTIRDSENWISSGGGRLLAVGATLGLLVGVSACRTTKGEASDSAETASAFGDDPMGVARRWTGELPNSAPDDLQGVVESWSEPSVARLYRVSESRYEAVVAEDEGEGEAGILLTIDRDDDGWSVVGIEQTKSTHLWPSP